MRCPFCGSSESTRYNPSTDSWFQCCDMSFKKINVNNFPQKNEETITIKKALWDEMLEYKKKVDELIKNYNGVSTGLIAIIKEPQERLHKLESYYKKHNKLIGEHSDEINSNNQCFLELVERIEKLEEFEKAYMEQRIEFNKDKWQLWIEDRIEKLENFGADVLQDFEGRINKIEQQKLMYKSNIMDVLSGRVEKLESKILELDKLCD